MLRAAWFIRAVWPNQKYILEELGWQSTVNQGWLCAYHLDECPRGARTLFHKKRFGYGVP
jgi:hypothetical protein